MIEMPQDPTYGPDPSDPHEPCEREIARVEAECVAAKQAAARAISFAELHALVAGWLPGQTFFVGVLVQHSHNSWGVRDIVTWSISYGFTDEPGYGCARIEAPTAPEAYAKLRAAVQAPPLAGVGDLPW
jgi:hypothetical protein